MATKDNTKGDFKVVVTEHERGWGAKVIGVELFTTLKAADAYAHSINSKNKARTAPDYYLTANVSINR